MADGKVLDFVPTNGTWRLWNYDPTQKDILPGNPVQQGKWASITAQASGEPAPPSILQWKTDPINFDGPAPVTGNAYLTLRPDGSYTYRGHFNTTPPAVPGITWTTENAWLVLDNEGYAFSFAHSGSVENPIIGSIDTDDWAENSTSKELAERWPYMGGARYFTHSNTGVDLGTTIQGLIDDAKQAVGDIEQVVAIVGPLVAAAG
jgi:hypothetical protein